MTSPYDPTAAYFYDNDSGNSKIDPLLTWGERWTNPTITYSFPQAGSSWISGYGTDHEPTHGFKGFTSAQQNAAQAALASWAAVANINFVEVPDNGSEAGTIRFGFSGALSNTGAAAWAYFPDGGYPEAGDVWLDPNYSPNLKMAPGQFGFSTLVHELGHALGLDHPFADFPGEIHLPAAQDNQRYSIMSYTLYSGSTIEAYGPMLYDIAAIQYIYGANMTTHAGDDVYTFSTSKEYLECIWDAGGHDTIDLSNQTRNQVIDLHAGTFSSIGVKNNGATATGNIGIAFNVTIEDAVGGKGADKITGNDVDNNLQGGAGNDTLSGAGGKDTLDGGTGADSMAGGKGDDLFLVDNALDKVTEAAGEGFDTVQSMVSYSMASFANVEVLELVGAGNLNATGSATANTLIGNDGNNALDGGGDADVLKGGGGNDVYTIDSSSDVVDEEGHTDSADEVRATFRLGSVLTDVENYTYLGGSAWTFTGDANNNQISGGSGNDILDGAAGNDKLLGNGGNDTLIGGDDNDYLDGGAGNDKLKGGEGNDTYVLGAGDTIDEQGNTDTGDTVRAAVTVDLSSLAGGAIENAVLLGTTALNATGNSSVNKLTGNDAANTLNGLGGADFLTGGKGADTYIVDDLGDQVTETTSGTAGGIDLVKSSVDFTLGANLENLTLTGSGKADGLGNGLNNILIGNKGDNRLDGAGGNDTMTGGEGNDTYVVGSAGDIVNETVLNSANGGVDTVESSITYSLAAKTNIENLTLLPGAGNINGTGNALANLILGNEGNNVLNGGTGGDTLKGAAGNDSYVVDNLSDVVDEEGNLDSGDSIKTSVKITTAFAGVENYTYTGTTAWNFTGNELNNKIVGGSGNDTLTGLGGNDWLDGGLGNDKMRGGAGNDTYVMNVATDLIDEEGNADLEDTVRSAVTVNLLTLAAGAIENAILTGALAINATGNDADNDLTGNAAANQLNGGLGADKMDGGLGADIYTVDNTSDQVIEATAGAAGGIDLVKAGVTYSLAALVNVENLTLTGHGDFNATGNDLANVLVGNDGKNTLDGGKGSDTMTGGAGDDTYVVNSAGDVVNETVLNSKGGGHDTVESTVTFTLATRTNIEDLALQGNGNINGTGNALDNAITGNDGNNTLDGGTGNDALVGGAGNDSLIGGTGNDSLGGGDGNDTLTGGAGNDTFDFNLVSELGDLDTIKDFTKGADKLNILDLLDDSDYAGLHDLSSVTSAGYLSFTYSGTGGTTTNLWFDADGSGSVSSATALASLLNVHLTSADTGSFIV